ncbi:MAG: phenylacetate--CoA ligase PaaK [Paracoccaceae bacterium]
MREPMTHHRPSQPVADLRDPMENVSVDRLRATQLDRLRQSLRHAHDMNPVQRARFAAAGVAPDDLRDLSDLAKFPFTTKADLRDAYPFGLFAVPRERVVRLHASSGTTGRPTVVGYTARDLETWAEVMARSIRAAGGRAGDIVHNSFGYGLFTGGMGFHQGAERLGCTVVPVSGGMTERQVMLIEDFRPRLIFGTPSYMLSVIDAFRARGLDPARSSLEIGLFGAEPWTSGMRDEIEAAFGMRAHDLYGLSEIIGPGVAVECADDPRDGGMTLWEDHFYPEIIDPETGAVLPDGEWGELVLTSLTKEALPMVRYRTRDLTRLVPGHSRPMRRMARVTGRSDDMIILRGVKVFPTQIEELILKLPGLTPHFQIELSRPGRMDRMAVICECLPGHAAAEPRAALARELAQHVKSVIGVSCEVRVQDPGALPRSEGKAKRLLDLRPKS